MFLLKPHGKAGNNDILNDLFTTPDLITVKDIGPIADIAGNYQARQIKFLTLDGKTRSIVFERNTNLLGLNGMARVADYRRDCYLYTLIDDNTIEVYVSNGNGNLTSHLLMMLCDGLLDTDISLLRKTIFS
jgi:hypothetical protein